MIDVGVTVTPVVPLIEELVLSVAMSVWLPNELRVAGKVAVPLVSVAPFEGRTAVASLEEKLIIPP